MLLSALALVMTLTTAAEQRAAALLRALPPLPAATAPAEPPRFDAPGRAVSNWHGETAAGLRPRALALTASLAKDPPYVARCVRLNNGWCIKSAKWPGEIGADGEGHTAFATLADGADAAAHLLRRYYRDYGRRSALAIVRRWAPSECRVASPGGGGTAAAAVPAGLAPRGIGRTLRARFLARHRPGGVPRVAAARSGRAGALRIQPWSPLARLAGRPRARPGARAIPTVSAPRPVGDIAAGLTPSTTQPAARPLRGADDPAALLDRRRVPSPDHMVAESALLPAIAAGLPVLDLRLPAPLCAGDETRIRAYAGRIAASVGVKPDDDLHLFGPDGAPLPNLASVMLAMSAVELGTLRASPDLVAGAIGRLAQEGSGQAASAP
ncbi:hypothetical protein [Methylobacterium aerolatum]|uniref:Uncharacterized protein n=1 Tax=Methylobacterium aerolatum TaxID=418708 RepID=A0ABU0I2Q2_9HYPH|nr:hypothetical protein [Methylobacterium aerolatum]MDQ0448881.1 hypothetical protein [Methylobacterium aerolatum]GJD34245.1 hypothetical protein FMGBMHLM_1143 [Methylobacterium aerolatum]